MLYVFVLTKILEGFIKILVLFFVSDERNKENTMTLSHLSHLLESNPYRFRLKLWRACYGDEEPFSPSWTPDLRELDWIGVCAVLAVRLRGSKYKSMLRALLGLGEDEKIPKGVPLSDCVVAACAALTIEE